MKKLLLAFLIIGFLTPQSYAFNPLVVCAGGTVDGCSESTLISQPTAGTTTPVNSGSSRGQEFTNPDGVSHSIIAIRLHIASEDLDASESDTLELRIGDTRDFTSTYDESGTLTVEDGTTGWIRIELNNPVTIAGSATKYFGCVWDREFNDSLYFSKASTDAYESNSHIYTNSGGWNISSVTANDMVFDVIVCD